MKERLSVEVRAVVLVLASIPLVTTALAWQIETVDAGIWVGNFCAVAVDDSGHPHISYNGGSPSNLKYAKWTGTVWRTEIVDDSTRVGWYTSIALDSSGYPHISYRELDGSNLKYARWTGTDWEARRIDTSPGVGQYTSIAIDDSGRPHIAYHAGSGLNLKYAFFTGSDWVVETVDSIGSVGRDCSMALQFGVSPYVSYLNGSPAFDLKLAWQNGGGWEFEKVDTLGEVGWYTSIAIGSDGFAQIAYFAAVPEEVRVARWTGSDWMIESIASPAVLKGTTSIALDSHGYAHVTYHDTLSEALEHAYWNGSSWQIEMIDDQHFSTGQYNSISIDGLDNVHVAYHSYLDTLPTDSELRYAKRGPTTGVETGAIGRHFSYRLFQNSPNPFSHWTKIRFQLAQPGAVSLKIYDIAGRKVKVLASGKAKAGPHVVTWDGTDAAGHRLSSGVYFCQIKAGGYTAAKNLLLLR